VTYDSGEVGYLVVAALTLHLPNRSLVDRRSDETLSPPGPALMAGPVQFFPIKLILLDKAPDNSTTLHFLLLLIRSFLKLRLAVL